MKPESSSKYSSQKSWQYMKMNYRSPTTKSKNIFWRGRTKKNFIENLISTTETLSSSTETQSSTAESLSSSTESQSSSTENQSSSTKNESSITKVVTSKKDTTKHLDQKTTTEKKGDETTPTTKETIDKEKDEYDEEEETDEENRQSTLKTTIAFKQNSNLKPKHVNFTEESQLTTWIFGVSCVAIELGVMAVLIFFKTE